MLSVCIHRHHAFHVFAVGCSESCLSCGPCAQLLWKLNHAGAGLRGVSACAIGRGVVDDPNREFYVFPYTPDKLCDRCLLIKRWHDDGSGVVSRRSLQRVVLSHLCSSSSYLREYDRGRRYRAESCCSGGGNRNWQLSFGRLIAGADVLVGACPTSLKKLLFSLRGENALKPPASAVCGTLRSRLPAARDGPPRERDG